MAVIIISIASKVAKYFVAPIGRQLGYLFNYHSNIEDLKNKVEKLGDVRGRVERSVDAATRNGDEIEPDVEKWLKSVNGITEEAVKFFDDEHKAKKRCFNGLCPNLKSRYLQSKKAKKTTQEIVRIQGDGKFDRVSYPAPPQGMGSMSAKGYEAFESRLSSLKEIMEALRYPNINLIGVYGMGGVGKTTLVKEVAKQAKEEQLFDVVVMTVVSETPDTKKIQGEIADMLGMKFDQESELGRAARLCERLKKEKRILVILDDIWGRLDLKVVGIPFGDDHNGCKILLTSRSHDVLSNEMDTQKNFGIGVLLEEEAWNLFKKMVGDSIEEPDLRPTAVEVAGKCAGLPIAIVTVAKALKNKNLFVWKDALQQLRRSNPTNIRGMHSDVYSSLELSYNHLVGEEVRSLWLLCGLVVDGNLISTKYLLEYGMGLGLFQDVNTLEEAINRLQTLVHNLEACCLVLVDSERECVKMHDVVRDVAISIASREQNGFMVRYGAGLKEWPKKDIPKNCTAISLPCSNIHELPEWLECPKLKLFLLSNNDPALKIPDSFFKEMEELKVLHLTDIHFLSLPSSLHFLANLQTLCLDRCVLGDMAIIGELKNLEILSFVGSDIIQLPREIAQLTHLRVLDLEDCCKLQVVPPNVISSLFRLEYLCMTNSFVQWEVDGLNNQRSNASLVELRSLSHLIFLELCIPDTKILPKGLFFENLMGYTILVGDDWDWSRDCEASRTLKLKLNTSIHLEDGINMLLRRTEDLYLAGWMGIKNLLYELDREGFQQLKHLHVQRNQEIQHIINSIEWASCSAFPILESLFLNCLTNLEEICHGQLPVECFCKLRVIEVEYCGKLKNLFSLSLARGLLQLQQMVITNCAIMDEIVAEGREDEENNNEAMDKIIFPQLRSLTLQCLPELVSFCSKVKTMPSIPSRRQKLLTTDARFEEIISEAEHDIPISLFDEKVAFPCLEFLKVSKLSKLKQIWHGQPPAESCNLRHLVVEECSSLLNVVSPNLLQRLQNLETITVESCFSVEQVFDLEGLHCDEEGNGLLSHLVELNLSKLRMLRCIWNKDPQGILSFPNLKWLNIEYSRNLRNLFSPSMALDLVQLQGMKIRSCIMMQEIIEKEKEAKEEAMVKIVFPQLSYIVLENLANLCSFYPGNHSVEFPSLKLMKIVGCPKVKTFTSTYEGLQEASGQGDLDISSAPLFNEKVAFPNLEELIISVSLKEIWHYQLSAGSFCKLKYLEVESCNHLLNIVPYNMLVRLQNLESLKVSRSGGSLEYIFDLGGLSDKERHGVRATQLRSLDLHDLPSLMNIWKKDSQGIFPFQNLSSLVVYQCGGLRNIFTSCIAKSLVQLQELSISWCDMVEEIVEKEGAEEETMDKIVFPQVTSLTLQHLLRLKSFCQGIHISEWLSLKKLVASSCDDVEIFAWELISFEQTRGKAHIGTPTKQPLFLVDKAAFPNLEELSLVNMSSMKVIWQGQFHARSFCNLRVLIVKRCFKLLKCFPISVLQNFQSLEELTVEHCFSLEEVFGPGSVADEVRHTAKLPQLRKLCLIGLPKLMHLWKNDSQLSPVFQNITTLEVRDCRSLTHLLPYTIVKNLVQIKSMTVDYCKLMKEIIASENGEAKDETIFSQLNCLELKDLPNVTSFYPGNNTFSFPSLERVLVEECPSLKTFSNGILSTPKLERVQVQKDGWLWEGDLNTTLRRLYKQKNIQVSEED